MIKTKTGIAAALSLVISVAIGFALVWLDSRRFEAELDVPVFEAGVDRSDRYEPKIALIGNSWVSNRKLDALVRSSLAGLGWEAAELTSYGHPGAKTAMLYRNLFKPASMPYSSAALLGDDPADVALIIAGVNDTAGYVGAQAYAHHMALIVKALRARGTFPIILEVPEYGIEAARSGSLAGAVKRWLLRHVYHKGETDVISSYRDALVRKLRAEQDTDAYRVISFDPITTDYHRDLALYEPDAVHLNEAGRRLLAQHIACELDAWRRASPQFRDERLDLIERVSFRAEAARPACERRAELG